MKNIDEGLKRKYEKLLEDIKEYGSQLKIPGFAENPADRCYICKKALFSAMMEEVKVRGINVLAEGSNTDDDNDYRPGMKAVAGYKRGNMN